MCRQEWHEPYLAEVQAPVRALHVVRGAQEHPVARAQLLLHNLQDLPVLQPWQ
jgi:hypothetical protein